MRALSEIYSNIANMKGGEEIQKAYDAVRNKYQVFAKKSKEIIDETQMSMILDRMQEIVQQGRMMSLLTGEEIMKESQKRIDKECAEELDAIKAANTELMSAIADMMNEYQEDEVYLPELLLNVGKELNGHGILIRNGMEMWYKSDEK